MEKVSTSASSYQTSCRRGSEPKNQVREFTADRSKTQKKVFEVEMRPHVSVLPSTETGTDSVQFREETLIAMTNKRVQFHVYERVKVEAKFGASDIDVLNFQVSELHTPIGVQKEALLRCQGVISYSFDL
uniref:Gem (nuclear organelle) associated protein 7 n=1 Tax=Salmo trutta TaxID=8032 RepID=A0A673XAI4_SALTR